MAELTSRARDIEALAQAVGRRQTAPATGPAAALVSAIQSAIGDSETVSVTVETGVVHDDLRGRVRTGRGRRLGGPAPSR